MQAEYQTIPNLKVAAIKHAVSSWHSVDESMVNGFKGNLFGFKAPKDVPLAKINEVDGKGGGREQLYPAIEAARRMLQDECPAGVDMESKPQCQRKVIVVIGDGDPGISSTDSDYFAAPNDYKTKVAEALLTRVEKSDIRVDTICIDKQSCHRGMFVKQVWEGTVEFYSASHTTGALYTGDYVLRNIAKDTGGTYRVVGR